MTSPYQSVVESFHHRLRTLMEETYESIASDKQLEAFRLQIEGPYRSDAEETSYVIAVGSVDPAIGACILYTILSAADADDAAVKDMISFSIEIASFRGEVLGGLAPYNHSPEFWIASSNADAIRDRLRAIEETWTPFQATKALARFFAENQDSAPPKKETRHG